MQNKVLEVATRIYRKAYASISGRPDNAWQAKEGQLCVYDQRVNGGCAIGCNLLADFDGRTCGSSIRMIMTDNNLQPLSLAALNRKKFLDALDIPQELWNDVDLIEMLQRLQRSHDQVSTKTLCLEEIRHNANLFGIDLSLE